jgi:hypothetical protein
MGFWPSVRLELACAVPLLMSVLCSPTTVSPSITVFESPSLICESLLVENGPRPVRQESPALRR